MFIDFTPPETTFLPSSVTTYHRGRDYGARLKSGILRNPVMMRRTVFRRTCSSPWRPCGRDKRPRFRHFPRTAGGLRPRRPGNGGRFIPDIPDIGLAGSHDGHVEAFAMSDLSSNHVPVIFELLDDGAPDYRPTRHT
ncbi:hypothetical protein J6590_050960 [Homalodisca vitripennis]|nr:hypothetical protein J6590_050960 [Homalodisca vitripennis]